MATDLRDKLRQLGVTKGADKVKPSAQPRRNQSIESLVKGQEVESAMGRAFVVRERYAPDHAHGDMPLALLLKQKAEVAAQLGREPGLAQVDLSRTAFLDTETTGLSGGAGTLAFLVGIGTFEHEGRKASRGPAFHIRQFFLRDPDEEAAMLAALSDLMEDRQAIITFNGRGFDLPILQTRYTLARMRPAWLALPHLDLLSPARRVWRDRLPSCSLWSLENQVLGVHRTQEDVPGFLIPQMYVNYLNSRDATEMLRVMYHNQQDVLSMVTLAAHLCRMFGDPLDDEALDPADLVSLGKWYEDLGMSAQAEGTFRAALEREADLQWRVVTLTRLGFLLKRQERRQEAVGVWEQLAQSDDSDVTAHVELAKYYEWHAGDLEQAIVWTQTALTIANAWPPGFVHDLARAELEHRLQRLEHKQRAKRETAYRA
jgi:uncharacterized protein YprB with RNaseH-like and TPR domain